MTAPQPPDFPALPIAHQALASGRFEQVLQWAIVAETHAAQTLPWRTLKAVALSLLKRPLEALPEYRWLCAQEPNNPGHWSNLGNCLCELGQESDALEPLQKALLLGATEPAMHFGLARAYAAQGQLELARRHIETAIARDPGDAEFPLLQLRILQAMDRWPEAQALAQQLQSRALDEGQHIDLGYLLFRGQWYDAAIAQFSRPVQTPDLALDARIGRVMAFERTNRLQEAKAEQALLIESATEHNPKLWQNFQQMQAKMALREKRYPEAKQLFEQILHKAHSDPDLKLGMQFEYAAALDRCGETDAAMQTLKQAHALRKALVGRNHPVLQDSTQAFAVLQQPIPPWQPSGHGKDGFADPVFVVGFPRSGTTLLEQLLDAHPALVSFDEQPFLQHMVRRLGEDAVAINDALTTMTPARWQVERAAYFAEVAAVAPSSAQHRPVDKNPLNMVRLPLLQNLFPQSRVLLAVRHPCDVVLSCYQQNFRAPAFALTFETLESTAQMYAKVFAHWFEAGQDMRLPVLLWKYEDLVADTEGRARALFDFLQLPWHAELLSFTERAKDKGAIKTPSYTQVVEPVNARAVGRWQQYAAHFTPAVMQHLEPWIARFGY